MDVPERTTKNGVPMVRLASGTDGPAAQDAARTAAQEALAKLGIDMSLLSPDDVIIDIGRRAGGGSFWIVWAKEAVIRAGGAGA